MDYEIEFHPVGDATKAGDAISIRYGNNGVYEVMVVDGGTQASGADLVKHIRSHYGANVSISHVVSTHPDSDHASGLREILTEFTVRNLWVHGLWYHIEDMLPFFANRSSSANVARDIREAYPITAELIDLAARQNSSIFEPFAGCTIGPFTVLSPDLYSYIRLVPQFRRTPGADQVALEAAGWWLGAKKQAGFQGLAEKIRKVVSEWVAERWDVELLREGSITAAENETSTVLYANFGTYSVLLTADAGQNALRWACDHATSLGIDLSTLNLIQVPHHGSRSNVTPSILDRLLGPKQSPGSQHVKRAIVSCPKGDETHPRKMVVNAFRRRGALVDKTQGKYYRQHSAAFPRRPNEEDAQPFDWFDMVEQYD